MPNALAIGVPYETFWHLSPVKLESFRKAYELKRKMQDEEMWIMGQYVMSAVSTAVERCLAGRKAKSQYISAPILKNTGSDKDLTQEEKDRREIERMIAQEDLSARQLRMKGLPETIMN